MPPVKGPAHDNSVKTDIATRITRIGGKEMIGGLRDSPLVALCDGLDGCICILAGFDLDHHQCFAPRRDQVYFPRRGFIPPFDDAIPPRAQIQRGNLLGNMAMFIGGEAWVFGHWDIMDEFITVVIPAQAGIHS